MPWPCPGMARFSREQADLPDGIWRSSALVFANGRESESLYADEPPAIQEIKVTAVPYYAGITVDPARCWFGFAGRV